jgi:ferredoxin
MSKQPTRTTLGVDRIVCDGYGMCAELLPELIDLDDWGYPIISPEPIPERHAARARRAVAVCPVLALQFRPAPLGATRGAQAGADPVAASISWRRSSA